MVELRSDVGSSRNKRLRLINRSCPILTFFCSPPEIPFLNPSSTMMPYVVSDQVDLTLHQPVRFSPGWWNYWASEKGPRTLVFLWLWGEDRTLWTELQIQFCAHCCGEEVIIVTYVSSGFSSTEPASQSVSRVVLPLPDGPSMASNHQVTLHHWFLSKSFSRIFFPCLK